LDFNEIENHSKDILSKRVSEILESIAYKYGVDFKKETTASRFNELIKKLYEKYNKPVVVLVDEYDKPIISHIGKGEERLKIAKENQEFMKTFYDNLKPLEKYIRLVFITGVSKFSKVSIFSTLNNLIELDMHPRFFSMLGYTEEELRMYFKEHFDNLSSILGIGADILYEKFRLMYNGFRFSNHDVRVYNPYSVGKAFEYQSLDNYWFESGTPTFLVDLIRERNFDITSIQNIEIGNDEIKSYDITKLELIPLLFQTGYLTIKHVEGGEIYKLDYPNHEVKNGFSRNLLESVSEEKIKTPIIYRIKKSLIEKDYNKFIDYIKSLFSNIANINIPKDIREKEHFYNTIFYLTFVLLSDNNLNVYSELLTSEGRIDMVVETDSNIFIIEFKCNQDADTAIEQIRDKNYADRFVIKNKKITLIGINFDSDKRNIGEVKIVER